MKVINIVGARPQFIKVAPILRAIHQSPITIHHLLVHTGQHYDDKMSRVFFEELELKEPDYHLGVGSGSHANQTGEMLKRIEEVLLKERPDWVMVYGDTNSTLAGALAAAKLHIPVAHVEAGLRSFNKRMPEEINRVLTDHISTVLFCPTQTAVKNLQKEGFTNIVNAGHLVESLSAWECGVPKDSPGLVTSDHGLWTTDHAPWTTDYGPAVLNVGDIMYDAMLMSLKIAEKKTTILKTYNLSPKSYYLATVHRAENTDNEGHLSSIVEALIEISKDKPVIWPIHPRTKKVLDSIQLHNRLTTQLLLTDPVSYFDMLILEKNAHRILTDSGGMQKEAYLLKVPCVTLRDETEWVETVETGWNTLVGSDPARILTAAESTAPEVEGDAPYGDGQAAERIVKLLFQSGGDGKVMGEQ